MSEPPKHPVIVDAQTNEPRLITQDDVNALCDTARQFFVVMQAIDTARAIKSATRLSLPKH